MAEILPIVMPKWGLAMQEGMLEAWHVQEGQAVDKGQEIADIETSVAVTVLDQAGHLVHMEKAGEVNALIEALVARAG
jgi:multidrug efflux pump subunit AcrA (membrane-fusion protein)